MHRNIDALAFVFFLNTWDSAVSVILSYSRADAEEPEAVTAQAARGAAEESGERTPGAADTLGEAQTAPAGGAAQTFGEQGKGNSND